MSTNVTQLEFQEGSASLSASLQRSVGPGSGTASPTLDSAEMRRYGVAFSASVGSHEYLFVVPWQNVYWLESGSGGTLDIGELAFSESGSDIHVQVWNGSNQDFDCSSIDLRDDGVMFVTSGTTFFAPWENVTSVYQEVS